MATKTRKIPTVDRYLELVTLFPLRPIRNANTYDQARKVLRTLQSDTTTAAIDYKSVLVSLITTYEKDNGQQLDTSNVSPADIVRHLLAERGMSVNAFAKDRKLSQSALSDMLSGKRDWSKATIVNVADYFGLPRGLFLQ